MRRSMKIATTAVALAGVIALAGCTTDPSVAPPDETAPAPTESAGAANEWFDQALFDLFESNLITYEDALRNADSVNDLRLQIKLNSQRAKSQDLAAGTEHLTIV